MRNKTIEAIVVGAINVTAIIGFVYLAMHFDRWWISLFALLFLFSTGAGGGDQE